MVGAALTQPMKDAKAVIRSPEVENLTIVTGGGIEEVASWIFKSTDFASILYL